LGTRAICPELLDKHKAQNIREMRGAEEIIKNGGWHFSFLGGTSFIKQKIMAYSHTEYNSETILNNIENCLEENIDIFNRSDMIFQKIDIDDSFPKYIKENKEELSWKKLLVF